MTFLHGVETKETAAGLRPVVTPPTCVIALVGTAPNFLAQGPFGVGLEDTKGRPTVVTSYKDAARFGPDIKGYTIPNALKRILAYGSARVIVVDIFDREKHTKSVADEAVTMAESGIARLENAGVAELVLKNGDTELALGEDYTFDAATGEIRRVKGTAKIPPAGAVLTASYSCADFTAILSSDVIGTTDISGTKTGIQSLFDAPANLGVKPSRIIVPGFGTAGSAVAAALIAAAGKLRARTYLDVPVGVTVEEAIAGRGEGGVVDLGTSSQRVELCYPHVKVLAGDDEMSLEPLSQHLAGIAAWTDANEGFWYSTSNHELLGVVGLEYPIEWSLNDPNCEANRLNEVGIICAVRPFGSGFRTWGNRSAAWPTDTHPLNFCCVRDVADIVHDAIEGSMLPWIDKPLTRPVLDAIKESVLAYLDKLKLKGAIVDGSFAWPPELNPEAELALGHATYELEFVPPTPLERVTIQSSINTALLRSA